MADLKAKTIDITDGEVTASSDFTYNKKIGLGDNGTYEEKESDAPNDVAIGKYTLDGKRSGTPSIFGASDSVAVIGDVTASKDMIYNKSPVTGTTGTYTGMTAIGKTNPTVIRDN